MNLLSDIDVYRKRERETQARLTFFLYLSPRVCKHTVFLRGLSHRRRTILQFLVAFREKKLTLDQRMRKKLWKLRKFVKDKFKILMFTNREK